ncbi:MAG: 4-hydroxy-3-methylbut-2-enyl diphosphate reductase [Lachnospiraceae bacterium]|nr:4-hydroxy-3-methylbut-2-enyl diphosphate reductase [Lachnospiraceae bacterium]
MKKEVTLAKSAGFCFGVERAVNICIKESEKYKDSDKKVFTLGPIIHNEEVVKDLKQKGIDVINEPGELKNPQNSVVIIRSHGVKKAIIDELEKMGVTVVSATCPFVSKIHNIALKTYNDGDQLIIVGSRNHPEVIGINGWCNDTAIIIENEEEAKNLKFDNNKKVIVVAQTTFNFRKFKYIVDILKKNCYTIVVMNTICNATEERQIEAKEISEISEAMLVIGGKHSSNTQKLYEICKERCPNTHFIQTLDDLSSVELESFRSVGITAGASTPNKIIKEVQSYVSREQ